MYNSINVDLFDILENDLFLFDSLGSVFICGDLNSRVGQKSDYIIFDKLNDCCDCPDYVFDSTPARASNDRSHNNHGIKLLDLCKGTCYRIINGRIGNTDQYTFLSNNGCSVIDYLLTKECNFSQIKTFTICPFNEWSDHAPLHFSLNCNNIPRGGSYYSETRYKWDSTFREQFRSRIISQLPLFNNIVSEQYVTFIYKQYS